MLSAQQTLSELQTNAELGLSEQIASSVYLRVGPNELIAEDPEPLWSKFINQL